MFSDVYAAAGGIPGPPPGKGPPGGIVNKATCRTSLVTSITQSNMNFGIFAVSASGTITLDPATGARTPSAGIDTVTSPVSVFSVDISNQAGCEKFDLKVTLPTAATLTEPGGATMALSNFTATTSLNPGTPVTTIIPAPSTPITLFVGADITATFPQTEGDYTASAAAYSITLTY